MIIFYSIKSIKSLCHVQLCVTAWTTAHQSPLSMEFSRQECWSRLPFPSPGDLLDPGIKLGSPADSLSSEPSKPYSNYRKYKFMPVPFLKLSDGGSLPIG